MNAAIRAVVRRTLYAGAEPVGVRRGFAGLLAGEFQPLDAGSVADVIHRGGTLLLTGRSDEFRRPEGRALAVANARAAGLDALAVIGGDGSLRGAAELDEAGLPTVAIPATIDNDLPGTDLTIGFDTAVNSVVQAIDRIRDTATAHERTFVVEVMGRRSGFIALLSGLADGAESILVPEEPFDLADICDRLRRGYARGKRHSIIVVAEGAGSAFEVARSVQERSGLETRVIVLGHIQRGGSPTAGDRVLASRLGAAAVELLLAGRRAVLTGLRCDRVVPVPYGEVLAGVRAMDRDLYELAGILAI